MGWHPIWQMAPVAGESYYQSPVARPPVPTLHRIAIIRPLTLLLCSSLLGAQDLPVPRNAFAGVETIVLANGLKIWFKRLPGEPNVSVNFTVAVGSDQDPAGEEQLAHFLEHMLFADHLGKATLEIWREIADRGGASNGFTSWDRTAYLVNIDKAHALLAIDWLGRIASPHAMDPGVVMREREPVAVEVRAVPRKASDWFVAWYVDPPWLRLPGFWRREFGIAPARTTGDVDFFRSLNRIGPDQLRDFYDRWYAPSRMTLTIVGDVDRDAAVAAARKTFGALPGRDPAPFTDSLKNPGRERRSYAWIDRSNVSYSDRYKVYHRSPSDDVRLEFIASLLQQRLNNRLRFGERKAAYGVSAYVERRRQAAVLVISSTIKAAEFQWARDVIDEEIAAIRDGTLSDSVFMAERASVARTLRVQTASARALAGWAMNTFYDSRIHRDFPDVVSDFESVTQPELSRFARDVFATERRVVQVAAPLPLPQSILVVILASIVAGVVFVARRALLRTLDITRLRYVARFRLPLVHRGVLFPLALAVLAVGLRLLVQGYLVLADRWLTAIPNFWVQWPIYGSFAAATLFLVVAAFSRWPRKLLVFEDGIAVKYLSYRSVAVPTAEIAEITMLRFRDVWLSRRLWRCTPLAFGLFKPAIYLRCTDGRAWFFRVRDTDECLRVLAPLQRDPATP
ncbi:MAG: pitrilysin family protein [Gemmatimonadetes bacterium]|nr:pitrilysin family protein [Gemmatimonadota bacterium]